MQERLDKWRAKASPVKNPFTQRPKSPGNFVPRHRDYGDDMREFEGNQHERTENIKFAFELD